MTTVEQALTAASNHMSVWQIQCATELGEHDVRAQLRELADAGRIDCIHGRGGHNNRYSLKSIPAAMPASQPEVTARPAKILTDDAKADRDEFNAAYGDGCCSCHISPPCGSCTHPGNPLNQEDDSCWQYEIPAATAEAQQEVAQNACSTALDSSSEGCAVAIETPGPDAASSLQSEGSGRDVDLLASANRSLIEQVKLLDALLAAALEGKDVDCETSGSPSGYVVLSAKRRTIRFTKQENARAAALSAIRAGAQRAEVFALVRVGVARKGAEWVES